MAWDITKLAEEDLERIAEAGIDQFGARQARAYLALVIGMFDTLAANPFLGPERRSARGPVRLIPCGRHHILYIVENEDVVILRILHALQNWPDLL